MVKPKDDFYYRYDLNNGTVASRCKVCAIDYSLLKIRALKQKAVDYKGGQCQECGYKKNIAALDFHHLDPSQKDFSISDTRTKSFANIKPELDKCVLLCANCHRELHAVHGRKLNRVLSS